MKTKELMIDGLTYKAEDVITFKEGLPGFEHLQRFLITSVPEHEPFHWMHSLDEETIKFILVNPLHIDEDYDPNISQTTIRDIEIKSKDELLMYVIVTINQSQFHLSTANMLGPILLNIKTKMGIQVVLDDGRYSTKYSILKNQGGQ